MTWQPGRTKVPPCTRVGPSCFTRTSAGVFLRPVPTTRCSGCKKAPIPGSKLLLVLLVVFITAELVFFTPDDKNESFHDSEFVSLQHLGNSSNLTRRSNRIQILARLRTGHLVAQLKSPGISSKLQIEKTAVRTCLESVSRTYQITVD